MAGTSSKVHSIALASLLALAGCASPNHAVDDGATRAALPALTPSTSAQQRADLAIERWWLVFNDAHLDTLIDSALANNSDLEIALGRVREAQAGVETARFDAAVAVLHPGGVHLRG
jgi:outer membrane protein TolC